MTFLFGIHLHNERTDSLFITNFRSAWHLSIDPERLQLKIKTIGVKKFGSFCKVVIGVVIPFLANSTSFLLTFTLQILIPCWAHIIVSHLSLVIRTWQSRILYLASNFFLNSPGEYFWISEKKYQRIQ